MHLAAMSGPGDAHEVDGHEVPAKHRASLGVALADKLWRGKRAAELERSSVERLAVSCRIDLWVALVLRRLGRPSVRTGRGGANRLSRLADSGPPAGRSRYAECGVLANAAPTAIGTLGGRLPDVLRGTARLEILAGPTAATRFRVDKKKTRRAASGRGRVDLAEASVAQEARVGYGRPETSSEVALTPEQYRVEKMSFGKFRGLDGKSQKDRTVIRYNAFITVRDIPLEAYDYVVNGKPAIEWVMERQGVATDKASGIVKDANDWAIETMHDPRYPLSLLLRVITVSLETMIIVRSLPALDLLSET